MRAPRYSLWALGGLSVVLALASVGCEAEVEDAPATTDGPEQPQAPDFVDGQGQAPAALPAYPAGPFGLKVGSIAPNYQFFGYPNAVADKSQLVRIQLADFYNPTGADVFPEGSPYGAGELKPKALVIDVASVWCGPCNLEAKDELPKYYAKYQPMGGEIFNVLADGGTPGKPASPANLTNWATKYKSNYPTAIDPSYSLGALFDQDAFPQNIIINLRTMKIEKVIAGVPDAAFWSKFQSVINASAP